MSDLFGDIEKATLYDIHELISPGPNAMYTATARFTPHFRELRMGYTIRIGNAVVADKEVERVHVKQIWLHDAPGFPGDYADQINERMPSYSQWVSMANMVGLKRLFFDEQSGLLSQHP